MVKLAAVLYAAATAAPLVASRLCLHGLRYCAKNLMAIGDYGQEIEAQLQQWQPCTASHDNYIYYCEWGQIHLMGDCESGCAITAAGSDDTCNPNFKQVVSCNKWYGTVSNEWESKGLLGS